MVEWQHNIGPHVDAVGPALGRQSMLQMNPHSFSFSHQLAAAACEADFDNAVWDAGYLWYKVLYSADKFVYMAI